jgi:hypothetical protein
MTMTDNSPRVERFTTVTAGDGSATLLYAYHTLGLLGHHLWCFSTPPPCGIPTFTGGTCSLDVKIKTVKNDFWGLVIFLGGCFTDIYVIVTSVKVNISVMIMISEFINDIRGRLKKIITDDNMLDSSCSSINYQLASRCNTRVIEIYSYIQSSIITNTNDDYKIGNLDDKRNDVDDKIDNLDDKSDEGDDKSDIITKNNIFNEKIEVDILQLYQYHSYLWSLLHSIYWKDIYEIDRQLYSYISILLLLKMMIYSESSIQSSNRRRHHDHHHHNHNHHKSDFDNNKYHHSNRINDSYTPNDADHNIESIMILDNKYELLHLADTSLLLGSTKNHDIVLILQDIIEYIHHNLHINAIDNYDDNHHHHHPCNDKKHSIDCHKRKSIDDCCDYSDIKNKQKKYNNIMVSNYSPNDSIHDNNNDDDRRIKKSDKNNNSHNNNDNHIHQSQKYNCHVHYHRKLLCAKRMKLLSIYCQDIDDTHDDDYHNPLHNNKNNYVSFVDANDNYNHDDDNNVVEKSYFKSFQHQAIHTSSSSSATTIRAAARVKLIDCINQPSLNHFYEQYFLTQQPVILRDCIYDWPAMSMYEYHDGHQDTHRHRNSNDHHNSFDQNYHEFVGVDDDIFNYDSSVNKKNDDDDDDNNNDEVDSIAHNDIHHHHDQHSNKLYRDTKWSNLNYLLSLIGHRIVPIEIGTHYLTENSSSDLQSIQSFIEQFILCTKPVDFKKNKSSLCTSYKQFTTNESKIHDRKKYQTSNIQINNDHRHHYQDNRDHNDSDDNNNDDDNEENDDDNDDNDSDSVDLMGYLAQHQLFDQIPALKKVIFDMLFI